MLWLFVLSTAHVFSDHMTLHILKAALILKTVFKNINIFGHYLTEVRGMGGLTKYTAVQIFLRNTV